MNIKSIEDEKRYDNIKINQKNEHFSILHQNVRSLGNARELLEAILTEQLDIKIVCLTEHWKTKEQLEYHGITNFSLRTFFCRGKNEHGGVAIYARNEIQTKERADIKEQSRKKNCECTGIEFKLDGKKHVCIAVYNDGNIETLIEAMESILHKLMEENITVTIVGDFNINMLENSKKRQTLLDLLRSYNLQQTIHQPTRITATTATCIDNIFTNAGENWSTNIIQTHISDHTAQKITFKVNQRQQNYILKRTFSKNNIEYFKELIHKENWISIYKLANNNVNAQFDEFHRLYLKNFNEAFPLKKIMVRRNPKTIIPNMEIKEMKNKLDLLLVMSTYEKSFKDKYCETKIQYDKLLKQ